MARPKRNPFGDMPWDDEPHFPGEDNDDQGYEKPLAVNYNSTEDINIDKALADQYAEAVAYRDHLLNNHEKNMPNHVVGAITSVNAIIAQIVKLRESVQNLARMQVFENTVVELMKLQPEEVKTEFFTNLELKLESLK